ncbi:uncharacterized protein LOC111412556 [Olea europaea var. sylvestris]|uniref:uncharacterized protein LOC111412556 n=1 Tax=Olea europaea var. sylvestris TaxID=158386 RepID=UPI000C1CF690|nr:uncharacterized protein LOC111412556 [Olea europaea var. sylvestris]
MVQANAGNPEKVICPCKCCKNLFYQHFDVMYGHLIINGMDPTYTTWVFHGEKSNTASLALQDVENLETYRMYRDAFFQDHNSVEPKNEDRENDYSNLYEGVEIPFYLGCTKYTRISTTVVLYKLKATYGISDNGFNELLDIIQDMLPHGNTLPNSCNAIKRLLKTFDLGYEKIHACVNDCCLFRNDLENFDTCPKCASLQWKVHERTKKIKKGIPAKNIGVEVYDGFTKSTFNLKAVLMWKINDLPAYGNLSGYPMKGEVACPVCGLSTCAKWLTYSRKFSYMGYRRFLAYNHPYWLKEAWFDGNKEHRPSPKILTGREVMCSIKNTLLLRHNLDLMHIEKNVCESILGTILHVKGKSKDELNSCKDLLNMGIRKDLHPELKENIY